MRRYGWLSLTSLVVCAATAVLFGGVSASAADPPILRFTTGMLLSADFNSQSGAIATHVQLGIGRLRYQQAQVPLGPPVNPSNMSIDQVDLSNGSSPLAAYCYPIDQGGSLDVRFNEDLSRASATGTVSCFDQVTSSSFVVSINVVAIGTGEIQDFKANEHYADSNIVVNNFEHFRMRTAQLSGTVSDGAENFTPEPGGGVIGQVVRGDVVVLK